MQGVREVPERGDGVLLPAMRGTAVRGLRPQKKRGVPPLLHPDGQIELTAQAALNAACAAIRKKEARPIDGARLLFLIPIQSFVFSNSVFPAFRHFLIHSGASHHLTLP